MKNWFTYFDMPDGAKVLVLCSGRRKKQLPMRSWPEVAEYDYVVEFRYLFNGIGINYNESFPSLEEALTYLNALKVPDVQELYLAACSYFKNLDLNT